MSGHKKVVEIYHQFGAKKGHHAEVKMIENSKKYFFGGKSVATVVRFTLVKTLLSLSLNSKKNL